MINLPSSKGHRFVLVATAYFTKWTKVVPLRKMTHAEVIQFTTIHTIHMFNIVETLTTYQGSSFMEKEVTEPSLSKLLLGSRCSIHHLTMHKPTDKRNQVKILIKLIKKKIHDYPKRWHEILSEALWAHNISRHGATKVTPFELVYGQETVLPAEVNLIALRFAKKNDLSAKDYYDLMLENIDKDAEK
jgi:hypothetical protein